MRVEQITLGVGSQQRLMRMLSMNIHQHLTELAQLCDGGGHAIDEGF